MRKLLPALVLATSLLVPSSSVFAETSPSPSVRLQEQLRIERQNIQDQIKSERAKLEMERKEMRASASAKLREFKDKKKATLVERLSSQLNMLNQKHTEIMGRNVNRMTEILNKLQTKSSESSDSARLATNQQAIDSAKTAIAAAQAAVVAQQARDYTIVVSSEATAKADVQAKKEQLRSDIKQTQQQIVDARQALSVAIRTVAGQKVGQ